MANVYTNYKAILSTSALTTLYTVGSETTAIVKSIRVSNTDEENHCKISLYLVDSDGVSYNLQTNRKVQKGRSEELLAAGNLDQESGDSSTVPAVPLVLKESEVIKAQAENGGDLHVVMSVLEIS